MYEDPGYSITIISPKRVLPDVFLGMHGVSLDLQLSIPDIFTVGCASLV